MFAPRISTNTLLRTFCEKSYAGRRTYCSKEKIKTSKNGIIWPKRTLSGIQPTGTMHIGNYFGAVKKWVDSQEKGEDVTVSIVDLHSITLPQDPDVLRGNIFEMTATLLACGINPEKSILFLQSSVTKHAELCWVLGCHTTMARLAHLPQFKDKSQSMKEVPLGLYIYPVLQAADILIYKATHVPVGEDQIQHLQLAQQIVKTFNYRYGITFPTPMAILGDEANYKIRSLRDPLKKMSKSEPDPKSRILLTDSDDEIIKKIKKAVTDFTPEITFDPDTRPGISNMINIHSLLTNKIPEEICEEVEGYNTVMYKKMLGTLLCEYFGPIRKKIEEYLSEPQYLIEVLNKGATKANERAEKTLKEVYERVGLGIPQAIEKKASIKKKVQQS